MSMHSTYLIEYVENNQNFRHELGLISKSSTLKSSDHKISSKIQPPGSYSAPSRVLKVKAPNFGAFLILCLLVDTEFEPVRAERVQPWQNRMKKESSENSELSFFSSSLGQTFTLLLA